MTDSQEQKCSILQCNNKHYGRSYCKKHYYEFWKKQGQNHEKVKAYVRARKQDTKVFLAKEKLYRGGCQRCGITDSRILQFHHRDPTNKSFTISVRGTGNLARIREEINKCDVLCVNCHMITTFEEKGYRDMSKVSWDTVFTEIARTMSLRSTCPRLNTGTVIVSQDHRILSTGYNGAPDKASECLTHGCIMVEGHCTRAIHAEANAILYAARRGIGIDNSILYSLYAPCIHCSLLIVQAGIYEVIYKEDYRSTVGIKRLEELGVIVRRYEAGDIGTTHPMRRRSDGERLP